MAHIPHSQLWVSSRCTWCRNEASPLAGSTIQTPPAPHLWTDSGWVLGVWGSQCSCRVQEDPAGVLGPGQGSAHSLSKGSVGGLQNLSSHPSNNPVPRYTHRTPAPIRLGDVVRSTVTKRSEVFWGTAATPGTRGDSALLLRRYRGSSSAWGCEQGQGGSSMLQVDGGGCACSHVRHCSL